MTPFTSTTTVPLDDPKALRAFLAAVGASKATLYFLDRYPDLATGWDTVADLPAPTPVAPTVTGAQINLPPDEAVLSGAVIDLLALLRPDGFLARLRALPAIWADAYAPEERPACVVEAIALLRDGDGQLPDEVTRKRLRQELQQLAEDEKEHHYQLAIANNGIVFSDQPAKQAQFDESNRLRMAAEALAAGLTENAIWAAYEAQQAFTRLNAATLAGQPQPSSLACAQGNPFRS